MMKDNLNWKVFLQCIHYCLQTISPDALTSTSRYLVEVSGQSLLSLLRRSSKFRSNFFPLQIEKIPRFIFYICHLRPKVYNIDAKSRLPVADN